MFLTSDLSSDNKIFLLTILLNLNIFEHFIAPWLKPALIAYFWMSAAARPLPEEPAGPPVRVAGAVVEGVAGHAVALPAPACAKEAVSSHVLPAPVYGPLAGLLKVAITTEAQECVLY